MIATLDGRSTAKHSRERLPLGTIRVTRKSRGAPPRRIIKVRDEGRGAQKWTTYARWWWEQHRGPVPKGRRVIHLDGDSLNDDPANLAIGTLGDVIYLAQQRDPELYERNRLAMIEGTRRSNIRRGRRRRARQWLPTRYYLVDLRRRLALNHPCRKAWQAWQLAGVDIGPHNWRMRKSIATGFPDVSPLAGCIMRVLLARAAAEAWIETPDLEQLVREYCRARAWRSAFTRSAFANAMVDLRCRGWMQSHRLDRQSCSRHRATAAGRAAACGDDAIVVLRGEALAWERFKDIRRVTAREYSK